MHRKRNRQWDGVRPACSISGRVPGCSPMTVAARASLNHVTFRRLLAQSIVSDSEVAERWYTALFEGSPQARPMDGLLEWHLSDSFGVQVWRDPERAGHSAMVLNESDLDALAARLTASGNEHDGPQRATSSRLLVLSDPDGNQVVITGA